MLPILAAARWAEEAWTTLGLMLALIHTLHHALRQTIVLD